MVSVFDDPAESDPRVTNVEDKIGSVMGWPNQSVFLSWRTIYQSVRSTIMGIAMPGSFDMTRLFVSAAAVGALFALH